jgi:PTS system fructose-specific IIB component
MGAENLETTGEKLGHDIKVEVQGAMGAQNELTSDDIAEADVVIVAADTSVSQDRFEGKPLVKGTVKDAVNDAEGLIEKAEAKVGETGGADAAAVADEETTGAETTDAGATTDATDAGDPAGESEPESAEPRDESAGQRQKGLLGRLKDMFS